MLPLSVAVLSMAVGAAADSEVQVNGGTIHIRATAAPLDEVIDKLKTQIGMKVENPLPRTLVTLDFTRKTPTEAVLGVLEGLGLSYALKLDKSGERVDTLMVFPGSPTAAAPSNFQTRPAFQPPPAPDVPDEESADEEPAQEVLPIPPPPPGIVPVPQPGVVPPQGTVGQQSGVWPQPGVAQPPTSQPEATASPTPDMPGFPPGMFQRLPPAFRGMPPSSLVPAPTKSPSP